MVEKFGKLKGSSQSSPVGKTVEYMDYLIPFVAITSQSFSCQGNLNQLEGFMNCANLTAPRELPSNTVLCCAVGAGVGTAVYEVTT